jgi:hypothetical protein
MWEQVSKTQQHGAGEDACFLVVAEESARNATDGDAHKAVDVADMT